MQGEPCLDSCSVGDTWGLLDYRSCVFSILHEQTFLRAIVFMVEARASCTCFGFAVGCVHSAVRAKADPRKSFCVHAHMMSDHQHAPYLQCFLAVPRPGSDL